MPEKVYIELQAAVHTINKTWDEIPVGATIWPALFTSSLESLPVADVRPNIPGKWIRENNPSYSPFDDSGEYLYRCSRCEKYNCRESAFCPDCGATMKGGEKNGV